MSNITMGFTGHQGLPRHVAQTIRHSLAARFAGMVGPKQGLCSLAEGSDQMFAEELLRADGELVVVLPSGGYESTFQTDDALANFQRLLSRATEVVRLPHDAPSEQAYFDAGKYIAEHCDELIAVWDGQPSRGLGGTADVVAYARSLNRVVDVVWPQGAVR